MVAFLAQAERKRALAEADALRYTNRAQLHFPVKEPQRGVRPELRDYANYGTAPLSHRGDGIRA
jgi:hypothetical protein